LADPLFAPSRVWVSVTEYLATRHAKHESASDVLAADVRRECERRSLPAPRVTTLSIRGVPGQGLVGTLRIEFATAIRGPLLLGRTRFVGGGLLQRHESERGDR
jgi:CRISPR-associated protein Csb2